MKIEVIFSGVILILLGTVVKGCEYNACKTKANKMEFNSDWGLVQGCMVEYKPGKWIDINRYRVVDE